MAYFFGVASILWTPYSALIDKKEWDNYLKTTTHPIAAERLQKIAENMAQSPQDFFSSEPNQAQARSLISSLINDLLKISDTLKSPDTQKFMALRAMKIDINAMSKGHYTPADINPMINDDE